PIDKILDVGEGGACCIGHGYTSQEQAEHRLRAAR
ncbi:MAG: hypothetical protein RL291_554, partial [Pseudomonadota bacterium]